MLVAASIATAALTACHGGDTQEQSPGEVLARDSALSRGLWRAADSTPVAEAVIATPAVRSAALPTVKPVVRSGAESRLASARAPRIRRDDGCAAATAETSPSCLPAYLEHSEARLTRNYQAVIRAVIAAVGRGGAGPGALDSVRDAQRAWIVYRDERCRQPERTTTEPSLDRVRCLGQQAEFRAEELAQSLARLTPP